MVVQYTSNDTGIIVIAKVACIAVGIVESSIAHTGSVLLNEGGIGHAHEGVSEIHPQSGCG